jgi:hypothetical protein
MTRTAAGWLIGLGGLAWVAGGAGCDVAADHHTDEDATDGTDDGTDHDHGTDPGPFDLVFEGTGFGVHTNDVLRAALVDEDAGRVVARDDTVVSAGSFRLTFSRVLEPGVRYHMDYYADFNDSGACDAPPADHVWRVALPAVTGDTALPVSHSIPFEPAACESFVVPEGPFDLALGGTGYGAYDGRTIFAALVDAADGTVLGWQDGPVASGEFWVFFLDQLEAAGVYRADFYVDVDGDAHCDATVDSAWTVAVPYAEADVRLEVPYSAEVAPAACDSFPTPEERFDLTFAGSGFDVHDGDRLHASLVDVPAAAVLATDSAVVADGRFAVSWPAAASSDGSYRVDYYVDLDGDGLCDTPPVDHAWSLEVPEVTADTTLVVSHSTAFQPSACASFPMPGRYSLSLVGSSFGVHDGETLAAVVVDETTGSRSARETTVVAGGAFELAWPGALEAGRAYHIDYYVDVDGDGDCTAPPADHVWSVDLPVVASDVRASVTHSTTFDPAACDSF